MRERPPALMTIEEAARLLRVGRTKAYAMAREWRVTGGSSGLPVVDFGHVLRVPRQALENLIGAELHDATEVVAGATRVGSDPVPATAHEPVDDTGRPGDEVDQVPATPTPTPRTRTRTRRTHNRRQRQPSPNQTTLPFTNYP